MMTKDTVTITLPYPDKVLHPNGGNRHHRRKVDRLKKQHRGTAKLLTILARGRCSGLPWRKARIDATWYHPQQYLRRHDDDNLTAWLKSYRDGVADAGIVADDKHCKMRDHIQSNDKSNPRVELTFTRLEGKDGK